MPEGGKAWTPKVLGMPRGQWKQAIAVGTIASSQMTVANGDADVFTKNGRRTRVTLKARDVRLSNDGHAFLVDIYYEVYERHVDNTMLRWAGTARCGIPQDKQTGSMYITDVSEYDRSWEVLGKVHAALPVPGPQGTCIDDGLYRIDGKGDDQSNAMVELSLRIPFQYFDLSP